MTDIATINGVKVFSDKSLRSIIGSRASFSDGSWCDVSTGEINNVGPGFIRVGANHVDGSAQESTTSGPHRVTVTALHLKDLSATVRVEVHAKPETTYVITGPTDLVESVKADVSAGVLVIRSDHADTSADFNFSGIGISSNGMGNIVVGGNVFIGGNQGNSGSGLEIVIKVPSKTSIDIDNVHGDVTIGDTDGRVTASVAGSALRLGRVADVSLTLQGSGKIRADAVNGYATVLVLGSGKTVIEDGIMPALIANVQGSGSVRVGGTAETAQISVQGSGAVTIMHVRQTPLKLVQGSGTVTVERTG